MPTDATTPDSDVFLGAATPPPTADDMPVLPPPPESEFDRVMREQMEHQGRVVALNELTGQLCQAVGLDPNEVHGFRLTVMGGAFPQLEVWSLPPADGMGNVTDDWVAPLAARMADATHAILPGANASIPPPRDPGDPVAPGYAIPPEVEPDALAARILPQLADAINGAPLDNDHRDALTTMAHQLAEVARTRVWQQQAHATPDDGTTGV